MFGVHVSRPISRMNVFRCRYVYHFSPVQCLVRLFLLSACLCDFMRLFTVVVSIAYRHRKSKVPNSIHCFNTAAMPSYTNTHIFVSLFSAAICINQLYILSVMCVCMREQASSLFFTLNGTTSRGPNRISWKTFFAKVTSNRIRRWLKMLSIPFHFTPRRNRIDVK